jgi:FSR family fosmidomycin resistance protein-like MFS transporter
MHFPLSKAGMLASVLTASTSLLQPVFGAFNDRLGRRLNTDFMDAHGKKTFLQSLPIFFRLHTFMPSEYLFVFLGPLITGIFICSLGFIPSYWLLVPLLMLCGTGSAIFHPSAAAMVSRLSGDRKEWGMSLFVTAGNWGHSIAPLLVVPVATYLGLKTLPVLIFPAVFVALLLFRRLPEPDAAPVQLTNFPHGREIRSRLRPLFLHLAISILRSLMISGFGTFVPLYMRSHGHTFFLSGATTTVFLSIGSIGALVSGKLAARGDRRRIIMFSLVAATPLLLSFVHFSGPLALLALAASGMLLYFSFPLNIVMAQELFPARASTIAALMIGLSWGTAGLMMTPFGFFAEKVGLQNALLVLASAGIVAASVASFLPEDNARLRREAR